MGKCIAAVGSVTYAIKAQNALNQAAIRAKIVKLDSSMTKKGCIYGLEIPCNNRNNAKKILEGMGLKYEEFTIN